MESRVWYDELAGMLADVDAKVVSMKKFSGDLSYVQVLVGELAVEVTHNPHEGGYLVFLPDSKEGISAYKLKTAEGIVRRNVARLKNLAEV